MPITCRSTARRRSTRGGASCSIVRRLPTGRSSQGSGDAQHRWKAAKGGRAAWWLTPLRDHLLVNLKHSPRLFADETTAPVLDPGRGRTKTGQLWAYARDDRPWGGVDPPAVAYVYAPDRKAERPSEHLAGFTGVLQVDGYAGYNALGRSNRVQLAYCWSHVRRGFYEIAASRPVATEALVRIARLYAIEKEIRGRSPDDRRIARQELSVPLVADLRHFLETNLARASKKGKLADAIRYALTRWTGLSRFLDDGRIEIDSNTVERSIRPLATRVSLCVPSSSVCKHWKRGAFSGATRATLSGYRRFDRHRSQILGADLVGRSRNDLLSAKNAGLHEAADYAVGDA